VGNINTDLGFVVNQQTQATQPLPGIQQALVVSADATGCRVRIPSFHPDWAFGPCRYSWPGTGYPPPDTACLVQFVGDDLTSPWVIAWDSAPQPQGQSLGLPGATSPTRFVGGTVSGPPSSGTFAQGDFVVTQDGQVWVCNGGGSPGTWSVSYQAALGKPAGLLGAAAGTRYVGGTTTGAPSSGTFAKGDFVVAEDGNVWICTAAGSPGTWAGLLGSSLQLPGTGATTRYAGGTTSGHPSTGTFAKGDFVVGQDGVMWVCTAAGTPGTWVAVHAAALGKPLGLTVGAARFVGGTVSGAPTSGTFAAGDFVIDQSGRVWVCTASGTPGTWVDPAGSSAAAVKGLPLGLTGATAATRYVGATSSGAPSSGTFSVGDFVISQGGTVWICTTAGSPGTWTPLVGGTPRRHSYSQSNATLTHATEVAISGVTAGSGNAGIVTGGPGTGSFTLNRAGIWTIMFAAWSDFTDYGYSQIRLDWPSGAFWPNSPYAKTDICDGRYRGSGTANAGTVNQQVSWTGYVDAAAAARPITALAYQTNHALANLPGYAYWIELDYLGGGP
jgi:hypothetical protein